MPWDRGHHHVAEGSRKTMLYAPSNFPPIGGKRPRAAAAVRPTLRAQVVHDDFGVGFAGQWLLSLFKQLLAELAVVGQLAVEGEAEPLRF